MLFERKKELPIDELKRQVKAYHAISKRYNNAIVIDVDKPLEYVVMQVTHEILLRKALRTAKGMKIKLDDTGIPT